MNEDVEVIVIEPENVEQAIYEALMENDEELLKALYKEMINSDYMKKKMYNKRYRTKKSSIAK